MKYIIICFLTILIGCSHSQEKIYEGVYTHGFEVEIFKDTKTNQDYWVTGNPEILDILTAKIKEVKEEEEPYPQINITVKGIDKGKATNGLANESDKVLEITEIIEK